MLQYVLFLPKIITQNSEHLYIWKILVVFFIVNANADTFGIIGTFRHDVDEENQLNVTGHHHHGGIGGMIAGVAAAAVGSHHHGHYGHHHGHGYGYGYYKHGKFKHGKFGKRWKHGMFGKHKGKFFKKWK